MTGSPFDTIPFHTTGPDADVEPDWKQLQPADRPCCHSITSAIPQCPHDSCRPAADADECCIQPEQCSAVANNKKDSYLQHACSSQTTGCGSIDDGKMAATTCCKTTEQAYRSNSAGIDADGEEALTLEYQPVSKQSAQTVCMLNNSKDAATIGSVSSSSSGGKRLSSHTTQTSRRERVWQSKRYRRDGVMDLWTRAGLQLQSKAT